MMVLKKKEVVAAALVVLIGVAGYLNWSYQDTIRVTDGGSYIEDAKKLGEAEYVTSDKKDVTDAEEQSEAQPEAKTEGSAEETSAGTTEYFTEAKMSKDNSRSKALEILNQTATNESFESDVRKQAQNKIVSIAENTEKETIIENVAKAKGYKDISVYIDGESVEIIVKKNNFSSEDVKTIKEIVTSELDTSAKNIKIIEAK
ncbi:MAG: SpoIIIAH-like family protein [Clostridiales bacterium]|nr:SpoIIIAH-like family protein [Clostridiales bacterium]